MLATRVIPTLLCRGTTLVKGSRFDGWRSVGHVEQAVRIHQARGVDELIILDIGATPEGRGPDLAMLERITAGCFMPITVGGGVRTVDAVRNLLRAGADKVAVCTAAREPDFDLRACSMRFGSQAFVGAIDVRDGRVVTRCGTESWDADPVTWARVLDRLGAGEILLTSVDREGTMEGYDLDLIRRVSEAVELPVIAHGGCSGYADMVAAVDAGASAVAAGALFQFTDATPRGAAEHLAAHGVEARV